MFSILIYSNTFLLSVIVTLDNWIEFCKFLWQFTKFELMHTFKIIYIAISYDKTEIKILYKDVKTFFIYFINFLYIVTLSIFNGHRMCQWHCQSRVTQRRMTIIRAYNARELDARPGKSARWIDGTQLFRQTCQFSFYCFSSTAPRALVLAYGRVSAPLSPKQKCQNRH